MVQFTYAAVDDLDDIYRFIARDNPVEAARTVEEIEAACRPLDNFAKLGKPGVEPGTREIQAARNWVVVYELIGGAPVVLRIWHSRQSRA